MWPQGPGEPLRGWGDPLRVLHCLPCLVFHTSFNLQIGTCFSLDAWYKLIPSRMGQGGEKTLPGLRVSKCWKLLWETTGSSIIGWLQRCLPQAQRLHCDQLLRRLCLRQVQRMHFPKMLFSNAPAQPIWHPRFLLQGIQRQGQGRWGILTPEYLCYQDYPPQLHIMSFMHIQIQIQMYQICEGCDCQ